MVMYENLFACPQLLIRHKHLFIRAKAPREHFGENVSSPSA